MNLQTIHLNLSNMKRFHQFSRKNVFTNSDEYFSLLTKGTSMDASHADLNAVSSNFTG